MSDFSILRFWAESLLRQSDASNKVELRIADLLAAFVAGLKTEDGRALARFSRGAGSRAEAIATICAIARQSECDDIELTSCVTPGAVVIPIALAHARENDSAGLAAAVRNGYRAGIIAGRAVGGARALPNVWPTLIAAPLMAAVTVSFLNGYDEDQLVHAMALSLAGSNGRAGRPSGNPSGRWIAFAHAVHKGIRAAEAAGQGFKGDPLLCTRHWWEVQAGHADIDESTFTERSWTGTEKTEFKAFPIARQAATAVEGFEGFLARGLDAATMDAIEVVVPRMNAVMLSRPAILGDRISLLCNLGFQLACVAFAPDLLYDPDRREATPGLVEFSRRVTISPTDDFEKEVASGEWPARLIVRAAGKEYVEQVARTRLALSGDHTAQLHEKWRRLLHDDDRRDFFENVVNAPPNAHAMLWHWVNERLANAAQSGAAA
jgi:2-methylcitrate dehydratase PrpD